MSLLVFAFRLMIFLCNYFLIVKLGILLRIIELIHYFCCFKAVFFIIFQLVHFKGVKIYRPLNIMMQL